MLGWTPNQSAPRNIARRGITRPHQGKPGTAPILSTGLNTHQTTSARQQKPEATHGRLPLSSTIGRNTAPKSCSPSHASHFPITMANTQSTALLQELLSFKKQHVIHSSYDIFQLQCEVLTEGLVKWWHASYISAPYYTMEHKPSRSHRHSWRTSFKRLNCSRFIFWATNFCVQVKMCTFL